MQFYEILIKTFGFKNLYKSNKAKIFRKIIYVRKIKKKYSFILNADVFKFDILIDFSIYLNYFLKYFVF